MAKDLTVQTIIKALKSLDSKLKRKFGGKRIELIIGGGGAMLLAHGFPLATADVDGLPRGIDVAELDLFVKEVALELGISADWLNPYYSTFTHVLPSDFEKRLISVYKGHILSCLALGKEDLLIMKCFAGRLKDVSHAKALIKAGADVGLVEKQIEKLQEKGIPGASKALGFLDELVDQL